MGPSLHLNLTGPKSKWVTVRLSLNYYTVNKFVLFPNTIFYFCVISIHIFLKTHWLTFFIYICEPIVSCSL
ncbi:hypothetical protein XSR1_50015 [Xenorhabdus szentirmaii DSM 16338]|uniref:Uncharacterized protein n=1 Tax=Xenorhabdus szentirmaii DSM 16338 TaxID=1427518 RepID=W1J1I2_9GAMM|nr:hypothetical protein XSR1_50015 [Xenorhabdus szentirmaii DSM 16338]